MFSISYLKIPNSDKKLIILSFSKIQSVNKDSNYINITLIGINNFIFKVSLMYY